MVFSRVMDRESWKLSDLEFNIKIWYQHVREKGVLPLGIRQLGSS